MGIPLPGQSSSPSPTAATIPNLSPANIGASSHLVPADSPIVTATAGKATIPNSSQANIDASPHSVPAASSSVGGSAGMEAIPNDPSAIYTTHGTYTWISPITGTVTVQAWGGGGGGSGGTGSSGGYGGGGGGYGTVAVPVIAGDTYTVVVGTGEPGGAEGANGIAGSRSSFSLGSTTYIYGGGGGAGTLTGGGIGNWYGGTGVTGYYAGAGQGPQVSTYLPGGGGGGGAGSGGGGGAGGYGSSSAGGAGGTGGTSDGGMGGAGGNTGANGANGSPLGGGGGGGSSTGSGGKGADGQVEITWSSPSAIYTTHGTYTWIAPITGTVTVQAWGGGGGGSGGTGSSGGYGGGGGGYGTVAVPVIAGDTYTVVVGTGEPGGAEGANGIAGSRSSFSLNSTTYIYGGGGGGGTLTAGGIGNWYGGTGVTGYYAGAGQGPQSLSYLPGGGGGGAGSGGAGSAGGYGSSSAGGAGGTGGTPDGGNGGAGGNTGANGANGSSLGGGGGGGSATGSGGKGADGEVEITWNSPSVFYTQPGDADNLLQQDPASYGPTSAPNSVAGVRYADGVATISATDLSSSGFGFDWGQTRTWSNNTGYATGSVNGSGWVDTYIPHLIQSDGSTSNTLIYLANADTAYYYTLVNGVYQPLLNDGSKLTYDSGLDRFTLIDNQGDQIVFQGFGTSRPVAERGEFYSYTDPYGSAAPNATPITATYNTDGTIAEMQRSFTVNNQTTIESYVYSYLSSGVNAGLLSNVTLRTQVSGGSWTKVRQVAYAYYDGTQQYGGNIGDLMTAKVEDGSAIPNVLDTSYYRYYKGNSDTGYTHGLEYVFSPDSYLRMMAANPGKSLGNLTDSDVARFADNSFQYNGAHQVSQETVQGAGDSQTSAGGLGTYNFVYYTSSNPQGTNSWFTRTTVTNPDLSTDTVYTNFFGEVMLDDHLDPSSGNTYEFYEYNNQGQLILDAAPAAVTGYSESYNDLVGTAGGSLPDLNSSSGLITRYDYYSTTTAGETMAGGVANYLQDTKIQQGQQATLIIPQETWQYFAHSYNGQIVAPTANDTVYGSIDSGDPRTTNYSYSWYPSTAQIETETDSAPVISSVDNGPSEADVTTTLYDSYGNAQWIQDHPDGYIQYNGYDPLTGALLTQIVDDSTNLPQGWNAPGGDLNLTTTYVVDALGRTTKQISPNGNITYFVYLDQQHEERIYQGWNAGAPTGPTQVIHHDATDGYDETFTMTTPPLPPNGVPDGTEAISGLQTLTRDYTNAAGQVVYEDAYFNFGTLTYNTLSMAQVNVNFYQTNYEYDSDGRLVGTQTPNGTVYRSIYNSLGEKSSDWVGTNDSPANGSEWSPTNNSSPCNMVMVASYKYDIDGNQTQEIDYPGLSQPNRETDSWYDWRDRLVAQKSGVESQQIEQSDGVNRPIIVYTYDNLNEVTQTQHYLGDGVTPSLSNGVLNPLAANSLRAQEIDSYDDQGRVYQTRVYDVNPSTGAVSSSALTTNYYYDHRGDLIAESDPGGLWTKSVYDGAGRDVMDYTTDGGSGTGWSNAIIVTGDTVLEQTQTVYDKDGNVTETIASQRFDNANGLGALAPSPSGVQARVYYTASYYDNADRLTYTIDVGTNGGAAWTPPPPPSPSPPAASPPTVLTTAYQYNAMGLLQDVIDPMGLDTRTLYDNLGRTIKTIQNYLGGTETVNSDIATEYGYDGNGNVTYVQADEPNNAYQKTTYVYGVTTGPNQSGVNSNDILSAVVYPDPSTGQPSTDPRQKETYLVNALGQNVQYTDRNGTVHQYSYDVLGRKTADTVTQFATGVDNTVKQHTYAYDSQGNQYLISSLNSSGGVVNQVEDVYNGLDQLTVEYQSHSGPVNTLSTPKVQYHYNEMNDEKNNSRLLSMTYPDGYKLDYNYNSGLDSDISRLSSLVEDSTQTTLESYTYLGLDTVVERDHPQINVNQSYIAQPGQSPQTGDGGDKYVGLDRFGRVAEQNWYNTNTSQSTDRFTYSYNQDGDVLDKQSLVGPQLNETYQYDKLHRLTYFARTSSDIQTWTLDALGNFTSVSTDGPTDHRTINQQNQDTNIDTDGPIGYDHNGNLTSDWNGNTLTYDAWNHVMSVSGVVTYRYDGLGRLIVETNALAGTTTDQYYSSQGQVLEAYVGGQAQARYVWSPVYVNALVLRDRSSNNDGNLSEERLYVQQDANWNVTALVNTSGSVVQRYQYLPYGAPTVLTPGFAIINIDEPWDDPTYNMQVLWQGMEWDSAMTVYITPSGRMESPEELQTWLQTDPSGWSAGPNGYAIEGNSPADRLDPSGLLWKPPGYDAFNNWMAQLTGAKKPAEWLDRNVADPLGNAYNNSAGFAGTVNAVDKLTHVPSNLVNEIREDPTGMKRFQATLLRMMVGYGAARNGGENVVGSTVLAGLLPVADTVGVTNLNEAYTHKELISNRDLSDAEIVEKAIIGSVQVAATTARVAGLVKMMGPVRAPTRGGVGGFASAGADLPNNPFLRNAERMAAEPGHFDLASHSFNGGTQLLGAVEGGVPTGLGMLEVENLLEANGWTPGQPIRLISCQAGSPAAGAQAFANQLSQYLRVPVMAPASDITVFANGSYVIRAGEATLGQASIPSPWVTFGQNFAKPK